MTVFNSQTEMISSLQVAQRDVKLVLLDSIAALF
jgi:hypothetical protein